jgi:hypothetical protein
MGRSVLGLVDHKGVKRNQVAESVDAVHGAYRFDLLMSQGVDLRLVSPAVSPVHRKVRDVLEHRSGIRLDIALRSIPHAFRSDAVLAILVLTEIVTNL